MGIKSSFSLKENKWHRAWPECMSQHDVVYLSPMEDPTQGLPIGNGDIGALLWTEDGKLLISVNKCDVWDDSDKNEFASWDKTEEDYHSTLRHCGRIVIDFNAPVFDLLYQKDFEAKLSLATASANLNARTPFSKVDIVSYVSFEQKVIVVCCDVEYAEDQSTNIFVERWGSRTFAHWYSLVRRDPSIGLSGTETKVVDNTIKIYQKFRKTNLVMGARIEGKDVESKQLHSRAGKFGLKRNMKNRFLVYITAITSEYAESAEAEVDKILNNAINMGEKEIKERHENEWRRFWEKSFISIPENYIENIWYLILYYANSSSRGKYPPHFCNGLWGFNRDFAPWNFYFHWNMQNYIAPLHTANHSELTMPYYKYRYEQLPHAMSFAEKYCNKRGAFYADVTDRNGYNELNTRYNTTPGSQIAMEFWKHYQYTGDGQFLRDIAWPVICEVTRFYEQLLFKGSDNRYHIYKTQAYEGSPLFEDSITDIAMIKVLFPVAIKASEQVGYINEEVDKWNDIVVNIVDFYLVPLEEGEYIVKDGLKTLTGGLGRSQQVNSGKVFAVGKYIIPEGIDEECPKYDNLPDFISKHLKYFKKGCLVRNRYGNRDSSAYYGVPDPEIAPVYPAGAIGLSDKNSEYFKSAVDQIHLHPNTIPDNSNGLGNMAECEGMCMGWCPYPIALARLGLADDLITALRESISTWQLYCQGFGHYGPYPVFYKNNNSRWNVNTVTDADSGEKFPFPSWAFRHFDNEAMPIVCTAVNEMLLQSYDEVIRLCPAVPHEWDVKFKLAAVNGFIINAECIKGKIYWVCIESNLGNKCCMVNPWEEKSVYCTQISTDGDILSTIEIISCKLKDDDIIEFLTIAGNRYLITIEKNIINEWIVETQYFNKNQNCKRLGDAQLGLPRMF